MRVSESLDRGTGSQSRRDCTPVSPPFFYLELHVTRQCLAPAIAKSFLLPFPFHPSSLPLPLPSSIVSSSRHDQTRVTSLFSRATNPQALTRRPESKCIGHLLIVILQFHHLPSPPHSSAPHTNILFPPLEKSRGTAHSESITPSRIYHPRAWYRGSVSRSAFRPLPCQLKVQISQQLSQRSSQCG